MLNSILCLAHAGCLVSSHRSQSTHSFTDRQHPGFRSRCHSGLFDLEIIVDQIPAWSHLEWEASGRKLIMAVARSLQPESRISLVGTQITMRQGARSADKDRQTASRHLPEILAPFRSLRGQHRYSPSLVTSMKSPAFHIPTQDRPDGARRTTPADRRLVVVFGFCRIRAQEQHVGRRPGYSAVPSNAIRSASTSSKQSQSNAYRERAKRIVGKAQARVNLYFIAELLSKFGRLLLLTAYGAQSLALETTLMVLSAIEL